MYLVTIRERLRYQEVGGGINKILKMGGEPIIIRGFVNKWGSGLTHLQTICEFMGQESLQ